MKTGWSLLDNPFETSTRNNYRKMLALGRFTLAALHSQAAQPFFLSLYTDLYPVVTAYKTVFSDWSNEVASRQGESLNVTQLLRMLSNTHIVRWNATVLVQYDKNTPAYKAIFPNGFRQFHNGSKDERISAVQALGKSLENVAPLAALKTEVDAFAVQLVTARGNQLGSKGSAKQQSANVEKARVQLAQGLMAVYGGLVIHFVQQLEKMEPFFDLETLRDKRQKTFTRTLRAGQSKTLVKRTLLPDSQIRLHNTGEVALLAGVCAARGQSCLTGVTVEPQQTITITAQQLGDIAQHKFITLTNPGQAEGTCVLTLL